MSGGQLVVLDRAGREVKQYDLPSGSAILGSDSSCDIRIMLPSVRPHHATVLVHANQSVIRNVGSGETLLNGVKVSVAALRQDDVVSLGGRELRWRYANPAPHHTRRRPDSPALQSAGREGREGRAGRGRRGRRSAGAGLRPPHAAHRDSAPAAISTRQVAIVQPQRRDAADHIESVSNSAISVVTNVRRRGTVQSDSEMDTSLNKSIEEMNKSKSSKASMNLQNTTKATLWIESRKSSPRKSLQEIPTRVVITPKKTFSAKKSTPLRMAVLKKAQSAQKMKVTKIQAPLTIDHTKQAAIMLMTGHTPKQKVTPGRKPFLLLSKRARGRPSRASRASPASRASSLSQASVMEITDSDTGHSTIRESDVSQSGHLSSGSMRSPTASPIKSALKDPRKSSRKTESIKFDLSNLDEPQSPDDINVRLRYSESPSPRPAQSRARQILRRSLGAEHEAAPAPPAPPALPAPPAPPSPASPRLARGSLLLHRALRSASPSQLESYSIVDLVSADSNSSLYGSASDTSRYNSSSTSGRATRARSLLASSTPAGPKKSRSRSAVTSTSYASIGDDSQITYSSENSRRWNSLSTPVNTPAKGTYNVNAKKKSQSPVNTPNFIDTTFNISRRSRQSILTTDISKVNLTDNQSLSTAEDTTATIDASSKSRRTRSTLTGENDFENITLNSTTSGSQNQSRMSEANRTSARNKSKSESPKHDGDGTFTPKNQRSPEEASTPVLSILSLLESDLNATLPQQSSTTGPTKVLLKRKTIGGRISLSKKRGSVKSKSLRISTRASLRSSKALNISPTLSDNIEDVPQDDCDTTPKSAVKLVQEAVKNKHSTAKKPKSKRSIIDNLNDSDIVKQLFNSPVKRKLSQSMIEFSRKQNLENDIDPISKVKRRTIALGDTTPDNSVMEQSQAIDPEIFVSPLSSSPSPDVLGVKRLFAKSTPENDLRNVRGVKKLLQTPRLRRSVKNDLTHVSGVKTVFARSPENRLSDVRVKEMFAASPKNDLRRISGVKSLFQSEKKNKSPKNDLRDIANVRNLYKRNSPRNDLGNVSGVKRVMRRNSPRNDLDDVRGVRTLFHLDKQRDDLNNISGIEELFSESHQTSNVTDVNSENSFNLLIGKPAVRSYGSKAKSFSLKSIQKPKHRRAKSLQASFSSISNNVEDWLENELRKRMHNGDENSASAKKSLDKANDDNRFESNAKSNKSSSIISKSMSRSKHILELTISGEKGRESASIDTNTVEGNKSKINVSNISVNRSTKNRKASKRYMSRSRNETASKVTSFTAANDEISIRNIDTSKNSPNKSKTNRATPKKSISRSQNETPVIMVEDDLVNGGNKTHSDASNTSINKSQMHKELTPKRSTSKSQNKTAINNVDNDQILKGSETQSEPSNKSKTFKELTPRKSLDKSKNRTSANNTDVLESNELSKDNTKNNTSTSQPKTPTVETPRKSVSRSKNKTNRSRELLKLAIDTVEGNTPLLSTRIRNSTLTKTITEEGERKKSTSEIYSAHTLPIKKRSLVDRDTSGNKSEKSVLPIKKRAVVHSTPVKGRINLTMNASEIGRVSPIAPLIEETIDADDPTNRDTQETKTSPRRKLLTARSSKIVPVPDAIKEKTSPVGGRSTRHKTKQSLDVNNVKKRKSALVITKKAPALSPKASTNVFGNTPALLENTEPIIEPRSRNVTRDSLNIEKEVPASRKGRKTAIEVQKQNMGGSPQTKSRRKINIVKSKNSNTSQQPSEESKSKPRKTRGPKVAAKKVVTPKKLTRTKTLKVSIVISKSSPQMKPRAKIRSIEKVNVIEEPGKKKFPKTRNAQVETNSSPENNQKKSKSKVTASSKAKTSESEVSMGTRNTRNTRIAKNNAKQSELEAQPNTKSRRGRNAYVQSNKASGNEPETQKRSTRGVGQQNINVNSETKLKKAVSKDNSKAPDSVPAESTGRGRKRKIASEESPQKIKKSKTDEANSKKKQEIEKEPTETKPSTRGRQKKNPESSENVETIKEFTTRRGGRATSEIGNKRVSGKKAESRTIQTEASKKSAVAKKQNEKINNETEVRNVRGKKKQHVTALQNEQNTIGSKRVKTRGEGDVAKGNEEIKSDTELKTTRRQKIKEPEKPQVKTNSGKKMGKTEKATVKSASRKTVEPEKIEMRASRRQKATEPEKPSAGRKRKNEADSSTAKEARQPSKTRKTGAKSPRAKRARTAKVEEPEKPAARSRRR